MSKLALVVGATAPLMLVTSLALAEDSTPPPAAPPPAAVDAKPAPAAPATTVAASDGTVTVHIQTKELVTLEHRAGTEGAWQVGCQTPCDARLPAADEFRIVGDGVQESEPFVLAAPKGDAVKIHVAPGLKKREKIGEALTIAGGVVTVGALVVGLAASDPGSVFSNTGVTNNYNWDVIAVATGIGVAGLATAIFGGAWWYDNASTRVAGDVQGPQPARGGADPRFQTGMRSAAPSVPTYSTTLFTATF